MRTYGERNKIMETLYPITLKVESIEEPDAANDIEITLDGFRQETVTIELDETQANDLAIQIGQVLQDRADQRTEQAIMSQAPAEAEAISQ
jgi:hypothetical protein